MGAEVLRQAASLMRERAEAATASPWEAVPGAFGNPSDGPDHMRVVAEGWSGAYDAVSTIARLDYEKQGGADAAHIASWHPAVALAVTKAMDDVAHAWEIADESADGWVYDADDNHYAFAETVDGGWLAVARTYLGSDT